MRKTLFALSMIALAGTASAQLTWTNAAVQSDFAARVAAGTIQMNGIAVVTKGTTDYLYLIGGNGNPGAGDLENIYFSDVSFPSTSVGLWQTATFVSPTNSLAYTERSSFGYNGRLYVVGGSFNESGGIDYDGIRVFNPDASGDITAIQQEFSGATGNPVVQNFAMSATVNPATGIVYIISGLTDRVQMVQIDGGTGNLTGTYGLAGTLPAQVRQCNMIVRGGYLYIIGGWNGTAAVSTVYYAQIQGDGTLGTINTTTAPLTQAVSDGGAALLNDKIYVIGGTTSNANTTTINDVYYSTFTGADITAWTADVDLIDATPGIRRNGAAASDYAIFVVGGRLAATTYSGDVRVGIDPTNPPPTPSFNKSWDLY